MVPQGYPSTAQPSQLGAIEHAARHVEQGIGPGFLSPPCTWKNVGLGQQISATLLYHLILRYFYDQACRAQNAQVYWCPIRCVLRTHTHPASARALKPFFNNNLFRTNLQKPVGTYNGKLVSAKVRTCIRG